MDILSKIAQQINWVISLITPEIFWITPFIVFALAYVIVTKGENTENWKNASLLRKYSFYFALPISSISFAFIRSEKISEFRAGSELSLVISIDCIKVAITAILITELIRAILKTGVLWSTKKHVIILCTIWSFFITAKIIGVLLARKYI